jgi:HEAT repeat protein
MRQALMLTILWWSGGVLAALTLLIVINKAIRETRAALDRRRRVILEPVIDRYVSDSGARSIHDYLPQPLRRGDRRLAEAILLEGARLVKGETRDRITAAFESLGSVRAAIRGAGSRRWWRRAEAAESLGLMRSRLAVDPLVRLMDDPAGEVRIRAARALGLIRGSTSIRPLVRALGDPSRWSAIRVAEILISAGAEAVDELLAAWPALSPPARISALDVLGRTRSLKAVPLLRASLRDSNADVRARAAHALGLIGDADSLDDLMAALGDADWPVRAMAAKALGRLAAPRAIPALCEALKDRQWWVRANAGEALRNLGPGGRDALIRMLDADDTYARHQAVEQLEQGRIVDGYIADLVSPDAGRREAALQFIRKIVSLKRVDRLTQMAVENTQEGVRRVLGAILNPAADPGRRGDAGGEGS